MTRASHITDPADRPVDQAAVTFRQSINALAAAREAYFASLKELYTADELREFASGKFVEPPLPPLGASVDIPPPPFTEAPQRSVDMPRPPDALRTPARPRRTRRRRLAMLETQERGATSPPPNGLRTPAEAAHKLRCSTKTLDGYVKVGVLKYVALGHGKRRQRRRFTDADLDEFITSQTRKDSPCPSDATRARRSGNTDSKSEVVSFSALQRRRTGAKPNR